MTGWLCKVAVLASSEFAKVLCSMDDQHQQMKLASDWNCAMDVILTEIKAFVLIHRIHRRLQ